MVLRGSVDDRVCITSCNTVPRISLPCGGKSCGMRVAISRMQSAIAASSPSRVAIATRSGQHALIANADIGRGEMVVAVTGVEVAMPTRYTLQVGARLHVEAQQDGDGPDGYPVWRFMNHGCEPNVVLRGRTFVAMRFVPAGEELTFDYDSTEWDMASPFRCHCSSPFCRGTIRGYRHLSVVARQQLKQVAPHLLGLA